MVEKTKNPTLDQPVENSEEQENTKDIEKEVSRMETENKFGVILDKLELEMRRGYRDIEIEDFGTVRIYLPNIKVDQQLSDVKIALVAKFINDDGVITREEVMNGLRKRGLWSEKHDQDEDRYTKDIVDLTREMMIERRSETIDYDRLKDLKIRKEELVKKREDLTATRNYFLSASFESKVDVMLFKHQMILCITKVEEDGTENPIWENIDALENDAHKRIVNRVSTVAGYFWNGMDEGMLQEALDT